ncbi:MAG: hypothetical protein LBK77_02555 [Spirochaetaceae bacterium]|jgi:hypothetical protein|nr:hypothetical protein [Spirochaetaceae bacterium]
MKKFFLKKLFLPLLICLGGVSFAQTDVQPGQDPAALIGVTLTDLIGRFGVPKQVYAVRGVAAWQDDVVFVYDTGEFYIFGNRVWQLMFRSAYNIKDGDNKAAVSRVMGEGRNFEGYTLFQLPGKAWPVMLRVNWDASGRVAGIYIYRSDF